MSTIPILKIPKGLLPWTHLALRVKGLNKVLQHYGLLVTPVLLGCLVGDIEGLAEGLKRCVQAGWDALPERGYATIVALRICGPSGHLGLGNVFRVFGEAVRALGQPPLPGDQEKPCPPMPVRPLWSGQGAKMYIQSTAVCVLWIAGGLRKTSRVQIPWYLHERRCRGVSAGRLK